MKKMTEREGTANYLAIHSLDNPMNIGLLTGRMGHVLALSVYSKRCSIEAFDGIADFLFEQVAKVLSRSGSVNFGSGSAGGFTKYWELAKKMAPNVILTGHLSPKELSRWYAAADVGVLSSYTEQCSYAALEMMNAGIAIVASDGNGLCDMFTDGRDAMVAHIGSVRGVGAYSRRLAARIDRALSMSASERLSLASAAKKLAKERYAASVMAGRYVALLSRLVA